MPKDCKTNDIWPLPCPFGMYCGQNTKQGVQMILVFDLADNNVDVDT